MMSRTYKVLAKPLGNLFLSSIKLDGTYLLLMSTTIPLDKKYHITTLQKLTQSKATSLGKRTLTS